MQRQHFTNGIYHLRLPDLCPGRLRTRHGAHGPISRAGHYPHSGQGEVHHPD